MSTAAAPRADAGGAAPLGAAPSRLLLRFVHPNPRVRLGLKVYTNMSGVTPSPPSSRFVPEDYVMLDWIYFSSCGNRCPPARSALPSVMSGSRKCTVLRTMLVSCIFFAAMGQRKDFGVQALSMTSGY